MEPNKLQLKRFIPPNNADVRIYFSRTPLTEKSAVAERGRSTNNPVLACILTVPGIAGARVTPYSLLVRKAEMFEWEEIEPSLLRLLTSFNAGLDGLEESLKENT